MASSSSEFQSVENSRWQPDDITQLIECCSKNITKLERMNIWKTIASEMTLVRKKPFQGTECKIEWHCLKRQYDTWKRFEETRRKLEKYFVLMDKTLCKTSKEVKPLSAIRRSVTALSSTSSSGSKSIAVVPQPKTRKSSEVVPQPKTRKSKEAVDCKPKEVDEEVAVATARPIKYEILEEQISGTENGNLDAAQEIRHKIGTTKNGGEDVEAAKERRHKQKMEKAEEFLLIFRRLSFLMSKDRGDIIELSSSPSLTTDL